MSSKKKHYNTIVASWLTEHCHIGKFDFPVLIIKYLNLKNFLVNFVETCKIHSKEVLVNEINRIINSDKFSRSYDNMYLDITFWDTGIFKCMLAYLLVLT